MKMYNIEKFVKDVLEQNKLARLDDHLLYVEVIYKLNPGLSINDFGYIFREYKFLGLPTFESVSRCRRKLQEKYTNLKSDKKVQKSRLNKTEEILDYVRR